VRSSFACIRGSCNIIYLAWSNHIDVNIYRPVTTGLIVKSAKTISRDDIISESKAHKDYVESLVEQFIIH
jgi:hypothetical protein